MSFFVSVYAQNLETRLVSLLRALKMIIVKTFLILEDLIVSQTSEAQLSSEGCISVAYD